MVPARAALAIATVLSACAANDITESFLRAGGPIVVDNETDSAVVVLPVELSLAALIDPAPTLALPDDEFPVLLPGRSMDIALDDIDGDFQPGVSGLALYVYEAGPAEAVYAGVLLLTADELAARSARLRLNRVRPPGLR